MLIVPVLISLVMIPDTNGVNCTGADPTADESTGADSTGYDSTVADSTSACVHNPKISTSSKK